MERERMDATPGGGRLVAYRRPSTMRLVAVVFTVVAGFALAFGAVFSAAQAAPIGMLKQFKVPTANSEPRYITRASDGNFWFTEGAPEIIVDGENVTEISHVGRITPTGDITEFPVDCQCFLNDIVQGSDGVLYFTKNDAPLGRITTSGQVLPDVGERFSFNGNGLDAHGNDIWISDFNNASIHRYNVQTGLFTAFTTPAPTFDVAVASNGIVWFTRTDGQIGRLNPTNGRVSAIDVDGDPREINIASDGAVWFTERFAPQAVGRIDPATNAVSLFPVDGGPEDIAPAAEGSMWFTRSDAGNIAQITPAGVITTQSKAVKGSEPFGITVAPNGDPWFTMLSADKIATLQLR